MNTATTTAPTTRPEWTRVNGGFEATFGPYTLSASGYSWAVWNTATFRSVADHRAPDHARANPVAMRLQAEIAARKALAA